LEKKPAKPPKEETPPPPPPKKKQLNPNKNGANLSSPLGFQTVAGPLGSESRSTLLLKCGGLKIPGLRRIVMDVMVRICHIDRYR